MEIRMDFSKAYPDCHQYAVNKLIEKFGPKGCCTFADYVEFYGEALKKLRGSTS